MKALLSLLLLAGLAHAAPPAAPSAFKSGVFAPPRAAPALSALDSSAGQPLTPGALRGKVTVLAFGFTHCPAICPTTLAVLAQARALLGAEAARLQVVFVSVDPARDDPARLGGYVARFDKSFIGLTGKPEQVDAVLKAYGISATRVPGMGGGYGMAHSTYLYFVDPRGMLRAMMPFGRPAADIVHDVRLLLAEAG